MKPVILAEGLDYPACPAFDPHGRLWFTELPGPNLCRLNGQEIKRVPLAGAPDGITFDASGRILFCDFKNSSIRRYDPVSGKIKTLVERLDGKPLARTKALAVDPLGNLAFTCPGYSPKSPTGYVCVLTRKGELRCIGFGFYSPGGLAFSSNGKYLVLAETNRQRLWRGYWDIKQARWAEVRPWAEAAVNEYPGNCSWQVDAVAEIAGGRSSV
jgi:gluconolactonase